MCWAIPPLPPLAPAGPSTSFWLDSASVSATASPSSQRAYGAGDEDQLKQTVAGSIVIGIIASAVITLAGAAGLHPLLELLDTPAEILEDAYGYIIIIDLGVIVMFAYNLCAGLLRAIGNSFMPLVFLILSSVLNVILDLWFIAVLGMGVAGAGVATVISQGVSVALCILYVFRSARLLLPGKKHFHVESRLYWELFSQSISMGLMSSIVSAGSVVLQYGINGLGTLVIAGHTAARKLFAFTDMPLTAMASACSTYVSQNYGANHPARVRRGMRDIYLYSVVVAVAAVLLMAAGAEDGKAGVRLFGAGGAGKRRAVSGLERTLLRRAGNAALHPLRSAEHGREGAAPAVQRHRVSGQDRLRPDLHPPL